MSISKDIKMLKEPKKEAVFSELLFDSINVNSMVFHMNTVRNNSSKVG